MMKLLIAAAAFLLAATTAQAENKITMMYIGQVWSVKHLSVNSQKMPMCMMSANSSDGKSQVVLMIKVTAGGQMFFHLIKPSWTFATGLDVPLVVTLDAGPRETIGKTFLGNVGATPGIMVLVNNAAAAKLIDDFAASKTMVITFKGSDEPAWTTNMTGSQIAAEWFAHCISLLSPPPVPQVTAPAPAAPFPLNRPGFRRAI